MERKVGVGVSLFGEPTDDSRTARAPRPAPLSDRRARITPPLQDGVSRLRRLCRPGRSPDRLRARRAARLLTALRASLGRGPERAHLRPVAMPPAADELRPSRRRRGVRHDRFEVPAPLEQQARLQSDQLRPRRDDASDGPGLGLPRAMGQRGLLRLPDRLRRNPGGPPPRAKRRDARLPRVLRAPRPGTIARARGAARDSPPPPGERRAPRVLLLPDLRPDAAPRLTGRP